MQGLHSNSALLWGPEALMLGGGTVTRSYHSRSSLRRIVHAIAAPIRFVEGEAIETSLFFALASDSSTDRSANKQELVYTRTLREGQVCTAFLGFWELRDGTAPRIVAAYKQTMLKACPSKNGCPACSGTVPTVRKSCSPLAMVWPAC